MIKWEYLTAGKDGPHWNTLGADGWELVAVVIHPQGSHANFEIVGYFKRRIPA